jgi:diketogulonate reductase-like aldo/keto reductase
MEKLVTEGKTRAIGVSNWSINRLKTLLKFATIPPTVNQVEIHPFFPNTKLVDFCLEHGIMPQAYSPLGSQVRTERPGGLVLQSEKLKEIAQKGKHELGQLLLAWGLQRGYVILPKSFSNNRIESNFRLPVLSHEEFEAVQAVALQHCTRFVDISDEYDYDNFWDDQGDY